MFGTFTTEEPEDSILPLVLLAGCLRGRATLPGEGRHGHERAALYERKEMQGRSEMHPIEYERRVRGITKAALGRMAGVNACCVGLVLSGKRPMTDYYRARFCAALGIDPERAEEEV